MTAAPDPLPRLCGAVRIRRMRQDDLAVFQGYRNDPEVGRFQSWEPMDDDAARAFIDAVAAAPFGAIGEWGQFAIADAASDVLLGDIGVCVTADETKAEIGVTLSPAVQGKGLGVVAVDAAIRLLFETTRIEWVVGITDALNAPSIALMERLGMTRVAEDEVVFRGASCVEYTYELRRPHRRRS